MRTMRFFGTAAVAFILAYGTVHATAEDLQRDQQLTRSPTSSPDEQSIVGQAGTLPDDSATRARGMMGGGMMRGSMPGRAVMAGGVGGGYSPIMLSMIFALMDSDGDGTISLQEFLAAHERIFKAMDANKDGQLTEDEMIAFLHGVRRSGPQQ